MRTSLIFTIAATIFTIGACESIQCYRCVETPTAEELPDFRTCVLPFSENDSNPKCVEPSGFCMKGIGKVADLEVTMRKCVAFDTIPNFNASHPVVPKETLNLQLGFFELTANFCETDLCNAASIPSTTASFSILFMDCVLLCLMRIMF